MTAPELFSLVQLSETESLPEPTNGPYFVATRQGYMVHQQTHWGRVLVPTSEALGLPNTDSMLWYDINLPAELIGQAWSFFRAIWEKRSSEAMVDITWSKKHGYRLFVPPQTASGGGVKATRTAEHYRGQLVGTMHSHCNFNAYHSSTDDHDADGHDGLHLTIGHVDTPKLDIAIMVSHASRKWHLKLEDITREEVTPQPFPAWWLSLVKDTIPDDEWPTSRIPTTSIVGWHPPSAKPTTPPPQTSAFTASSFLTSEELLEDRTTPAEAAYIIDQIDDLRELLDQAGIDFDYELQPQVLSNRLHPFNVERYVTE